MLVGVYGVKIEKKSELCVLAVILPFILRFQVTKQLSLLSKCFNTPFLFLSGQYRTTFYPYEIAWVGISANFAICALLKGDPIMTLSTPYHDPTITLL